MLENRQLKYFLVLAEELHFRRAAERLHLAQPALSRQIRQLEQDLGAELFRRTTRRTQLTAAGKELYEHMIPIAQAFQQARAAVRRTSRGEFSRLTLGYIPSASHVLVPIILKCFREFFPNAELRLRSMLTEEQFYALQAEKIDIALLRPWRQPQGTMLTTILDEPFVVALPSDHPLAGKKGISLKEFEDERFILYARIFEESASRHHELLMRVFHEAGIEPRIALESPEHINVALGLVTAGFGVALAPRSILSLNMKGLGFAEIREGSSRSEIAMAWLDSRDDARFHAFARSAERAIKEALSLPSATTQSSRVFRKRNGGRPKAA